MKIILKDYTEWKSNVDSKALQHYNCAKNDSYMLFALDGDVTFLHELDIDDKADYEANYLSEANQKRNSFYQREPFAAKTLPDGRKLFRRKHGFKSDEIPAGQSGIIELVVPYDLAKIDEIEITNAKEGVLLDFKVYDTPTGAISTVPNYMLNQFGFDVELPDGFYRDKSNYDADVQLGMKIELTVKNNTSEPYTARGNVVWHEIKV